MRLNGGGASDSLGSDLQKLETIMPRLATPIELAPEEQAELERLLRCSSTPQSLALRARIILMAGEGAGVVGRRWVVVRLLIFLFGSSSKMVGLGEGAGLWV